MTGFDVITYRKGKYRDWQRRAFKEVTVEVCGRKVKYLLGERLVRCRQGLSNARGSPPVRRRPPELRW